MILGGQLPGKVGRRRFLIWLHGQAVKTPPFHGGNPGSIPGGVTKHEESSECNVFRVFLLEPGQIEPGLNEKVSAIKM